MPTVLAVRFNEFSDTSTQMDVPSMIYVLFQTTQFACDKSPNLGKLKLQNLSNSVLESLTPRNYLFCLFSASCTT